MRLCSTRRMVVTRGRWSYQYPTLDLHGEPHQDAENIIEDFILENKIDFSKYQGIFVNGVFKSDEKFPKKLKKQIKY